MSTAIALIAITAAAVFRSNASHRSMARATIAVLPLRAIGQQSSDATTAIAEEMTTALIQIPELLVRPAQTSRDSAFVNGDILANGEHQRASYLVDGSVQREAGQVRITLRLLRSPDGVAVWAGIVQRRGWKDDRTRKAGWWRGCVRDTRPGQTRSRRQEIGIAHLRAAS